MLLLPLLVLSGSTLHSLKHKVQCRSVHSAVAHGVESDVSTYCTLKLSQTWWLSLWHQCCTTLLSTWDYVCRYEFGRCSRSFPSQVWSYSDTPKCIRRGQPVVDLLCLVCRLFTCQDSLSFCNCILCKRAEYCSTSQCYGIACKLTNVAAPQCRNSLTAEANYKDVSWHDQISRISYLWNSWPGGALVPE